MDSRKSPAEQVAAFMTRIFDLGLTTPSGGNVSLMDDDGSLWVTPSQVDKGRLLPGDIVRVLPDGSTEGDRKPSMEYRFHREIYRQRPDIKAVIHAHPPSLVAFSLTGRQPDCRLLPSVYSCWEPVGFSAYAVPGSEELSLRIGKVFASDCFSAFMENHGIITTGRTIYEAFHRFESLERLASVMVDAAKLGESRSPSGDDLERMMEPAAPRHHSGQELLFTDFEKEMRSTLAGLVTRACLRKQITACSGGFSVRLGENSLLVTPADKDLLCLEPEDLVKVHDGVPEKGKHPSAYLPLHDSIYREHATIRSIGSVHPLAVMAFAVTGTRLDTRTIPESYLLLKDIPLVPFRMRFTAPREIAQLITTRNPAVLIENDSLTVTGGSPFEVFDRTDVAEFTARSILDARSIGQVKRLGEKQVKDLDRYFG